MSGYYLATILPLRVCSRRKHEYLRRIMDSGIGTDTCAGQGYVMCDAGDKETTPIPEKSQSPSRTPTVAR